MKPRVRSFLLVPSPTALVPYPISLIPCPVSLVPFILALALFPARVHAATIEIVINNLAFAQREVKANVGDTIVWVNKDIFVHTSTAKSGAWKLSIPAGKSASTVVKKAGSFDYYCEFHPSMTARLVVAEKKKKTRTGDPVPSRE